MDYYRPPALQEAIDALGQLYRALKAWKFYPDGHPLRTACITEAHQAIADILDGNRLLLVTGRSHFTLPDGEALKDSTRFSGSLSRELFARRARKILFLEDLSREDLFAFIRIMSLSPDALAIGGGLEAQMASRGIRTIWVNEFNLAVITRKRQEIERAGVFPEAPDEIGPDGGNGGEGGVGGGFPLPVPPDSDPLHELQTFLGRIAATSDPDSYLLLVRQALGYADILASWHRFEPMASLAQLLADHADERSGRAVYALFGMEHLASMAGLMKYLTEHADGPHGVSCPAMAHLITCAGDVAVTEAVETIGATGRLALRKALALALAKVGSPAVLPLIAMADDRRWYVVRAVVSILGEIAAREAVPHLAMCLRHGDLRVRKEAIRSLARTGGPDAEQALIGVLRTGDSGTLAQAITSLGAMRSRTSLPDLLGIVCNDDMFLVDLPIRVKALEAIGLIGERRVVPYLIDQLKSRRLVDRKRRERLKIAIATCLGQLGDPLALEALHEKSHTRGELGSACTQAAESIARNGGTSNGAA